MKSLIQFRNFEDFVGSLGKKPHIVHVFWVSRRVRLEDGTPRVWFEISARSFMGEKIHSLTLRTDLLVPVEGDLRFWEHYGLQCEEVINTWKSLDPRILFIPAHVSVDLEVIYGPSLPFTEYKVSPPRE